MIDPIGIIERHWHISLQRVSGDEYRSLNGCPICGDGGKGDKSDRFRVFLDGKPRCWCRKCGYTAFADSLGDQALTEQDRRILALEARQREIERTQREHEARLSALEKIHDCTDHLHYHEQMTSQQREWWYRQGIFDEAIDKWQLGWCWHCPTDRDGRASYTIPIMHRGELENIRHRLAQADNGDKYRPHMAGLGVQLFNADLLDAKPERVLLVEGEKKTIVLDQYGFPAVGICGKRSFMRPWLEWFADTQDIIVALDPDAHESAVKLAQAFGKRARVATLPMKIDDAITEYGATAAEIEAYLKLATPVRD